MPVPSAQLLTHSTSGGLGSQNQFQVKANSDFGKFSDNDQTPPRELNFDQWFVDVKAPQQQYPNTLHLPTFKKLLKGPQHP